MLQRPPVGFRRLSVVTAVIAYLAIVAGDIVRVSGSGVGCGGGSGGGDSWPLCHGGLVPPPDLPTLIEFSHRMFAAALFACLAAVIVWAWLRLRQFRRITVIASIAGVLYVIQALLGAATVLSDLLSKYIFIHLANAELLLATITLLAVTSLTEGGRRRLRWSRELPGGRLSLWLVAATFVVILSGALVVDSGSITACDGWPLCASHGGIGLGLAQAGSDAINLIHRIIVGCVSLLIFVSVPRLMRLHRGVGGVTLTGILIIMLLVCQIIAGLLVVESHGAAWAQGVHLALASGLWLCVVLLALLIRSRVEVDAPLVDAGVAATSPASPPPAGVMASRA